jgi:hypothetical protein
MPIAEDESSSFRFRSMIFNLSVLPLVSAEIGTH